MKLVGIDGCRAGWVRATAEPHLTYVRHKIDRSTALALVGP